MTYPTPLKVVSRKLSEDVVVALTPFKRFDKFNFGARMAFFHVGTNIVVWSALPYSPEAVKPLELFQILNPELHLSHLIVPDAEHTLGAKSWKEKHPNLKIIAMDPTIGGVKVDHVFSVKEGGRVVAQKELHELGFDATIANNFEFVFLPDHGNRELVTFHKSSKTVFEADLLFNLQAPLEQFSPETGFAKGFNPHGGWSFLTRYMNPYSKVGVFLQNRIANPAKSAPGLKAINSWDFTTIVPCHGNVLTEGKKAFKAVFGASL